MDSSSNRQGSHSGAFKIASYFVSAIGALGAIVSIIVLPPEYNMIKVLLGVLSICCVLYSFTGVYLWVAGKKGHMCSLIQDIENMRDTLRKVDEMMTASPNIQAKYQSLRDVLRRVDENMTVLSNIQAEYQSLRDILRRVDESTKVLPNIQSEFQNLTESTKKSVEMMQAQLENMNSLMSSNSYFRYSTAEVTKRLEDFVDKHINEITEVRIICFGRNGYEQAINYIVDKCTNISVKVVFCNPEKNQKICLASDDPDIRKNARSLLKMCENRDTKIEIFASDIPPAVRASIVYAGEKGAIWGAIQSYNFLWEGDQLTLVRPKKSLIIVGDETSAKSDFAGIIESITKEFDRLTDYPRHRAELSNGKVVFVEVPRPGDTDGARS